MTTPTAYAVVSLESAEIPRNNAARSAGQISSTSISDRGTRSGGPVDLDETQQTIDSETETAVETNTSNPSARDDGAHVQEQNAGSVQNAGTPSGTDVVMQNLLEDMVRAHALISLFTFLQLAPPNIAFNASPHSSFLFLSCSDIRPSTSIRWARPFWGGSTKWAVGSTIWRELSAI